MQSVEEALLPWCIDEYSRLRSVCMCPPTNLTIKEVINETQRFYAKKNIDSKLAYGQYCNFRNILKKWKVQVFEIPPHHSLNEQVFTRDIAFTVGNKVMLTKLKEELRQSEHNYGEKWLQENKISYEKMLSNYIEGGDILIDQRKIWVGVGSRTTQKAAYELKTRFPKYDIFEIQVSHKYLHLDCICNILSPHYALVYPPAFNKKDLDQLSAYYELIEVRADEQFALGVNVLSIGNQTIISQTKNDRVNFELRKRGFEVIPVDLSEIAKSGGGPRCLTMPISRTKTY